MFAVLTTLPHEEVTLNLPPIAALGKPKKPMRYNPTPQEGRYIQYRLCLAGKKAITISRKLGLHNSTVYNVIYGKRSSARIESEIIKIFGKADWNEVVLEARSEVQKKPVEAIVREIEQKLQTESSATGEDFKNSEQALIYGHDWSDSLKAYKEEQARIQEKQERKKKGVSA
jgi:hypothetical protein